MIATRTVGVGADVVRYLEAGAGSPLVLLHAFPLTADLWRPQLERPPDGWRVLAPDLKGLGPRPTAPAASMDDVAGQVVAWMDAIGIERAVVGGLSMGGYAAFAVLRRAAARCAALVLANTKASADSTDGRAARDRMSALVREQGPGAVANEMLPKLLGESTRRSRPQLVQDVRTMIEANTTAGIDGAIQAMKGRPDSLDVLRAFAGPALIVAGEEDTIIPPTEAEAMDAALADSRLVSIAGAGHLASLEAPAEFSAALEAFLAPQRERVQPAR